MKFDLTIIQEDAKFWALVYQTQNDPIKIQQFVSSAQTYDNGSASSEQIWEISNGAASAFEGDLGLIKSSNLGRVLYYTALHESGGGRYVEQINGPARGWWQVEPNTAFSIINNSYWVWGPKCTTFTGGYSAEFLRTFTYEQMAEWLKNPIYCAIMAGAVYEVQSYVKHAVSYLAL